MFALVDDQLARQREALLVLEEGRVEEARQFEKEKRALVAERMELQEKIDQLETATAEDMRTLERMAERQRLVMKENDTLRHRLHVSNVNAYDFHVRPGHELTSSFVPKNKKKKENKRLHFSFACCAPWFHRSCACSICLGIFMYRKITI